MVGTVPRSAEAETPGRDVENGIGTSVFVALVALRGALYLVAIPLVPFLYREHAAALVALRPSKEVLLFEGFAVERGSVYLPVVVLAALPLLLVAVWAFFGLGRAYGDQLTTAELPGLAGRFLPAARIRQLQDALADDGARLVFLGRLAAFPSTLVAAAAGASGMPWRTFLVADGTGALVSLGALLTIGYALEDAYEDAGPWLTGGGLAVLAAGVVLLGRSLSARSR
jgi:membrane protein DedA with SNARE-associated domain